MTGTTHVPVPEQPPPVHPAKSDPFVGVAVSVTVVPKLKLAVQLVAQFEIPPGELLTLPVPVPALVTVRFAVLGGGVKVAETVCAPFMTTTQPPVPEHAPDQPENVEPAVPFAARVIEAPLSKSALQPVPQLIPGGLLVTVPLPLLLTVKRTGAGG